MAVVRPFRAVRYARPRGADISSLTAPPYDVVTWDERAALLETDAHNVIALELPEGSLDPSAEGNRYETGRRRWLTWRTDGVLAQDAEPAIYVIEQRYRSQGRSLVRHAFVAAVDLEPFSAGVVLPHERTLPKTLEDRLCLTRATAANLSPVFALFSDEKETADRLVERAAAAGPVATAEDADGNTSILLALTDPDDHAALGSALAEVPVVIADGHHRYGTALAYRDERRRATQAPQTEGEAPASPAYESIMMALVSTSDSGLTVLPTHRIADGPSVFDPDAFWSRLAEHFELEEPPSAHPPSLFRNDDGRTAFLVRTRDGRTRLARLRRDLDLDDVFPSGTSASWRSLDVAVLQELVLSPLLDIHPDRPDTMERLRFTKDAHDALRAAEEHDAVFVMDATRMDQLERVAMAGEMMPQKSTYFYPKIPSGLLLKRLDD